MTTAQMQTTAAELTANHPFVSELVSRLAEIAARHGVDSLPEGGPSTDVAAPYSRTSATDTADMTEEAVAAYNNALDAVARDMLDIRHIGSGLYVTTADAKYGATYPAGWGAYYEEAREAFAEWTAYSAWDAFCDNLV